jgi:uncharacterized protein YjbI with pentapeptide repeats
LASQGKAAAETARAFVREAERTAEKRNLVSVNVRILISGRELIVQENESEFRRPRQVLTLLPYFVPQARGAPQVALSSRHSFREYEEYHDPEELLSRDLRQQWWSRYGSLTGNGYNGLPEELSREDLEEITAQPLLNFLVALSYSRHKLDFTKDINLNSIYDDLVRAVYERAYEKHRPYVFIRHMKLDEFSRVLEEVALAAWHGDGRSTTVPEIEEHCRASGLGSLLDVFQEGARAGVTRLLAAFFFRQYGQRPSGYPTFVFTHKSFGEYLTARRLVRAIDRVVRETQRRDDSPDEGWDERDALKHWAQICGPSAISRYLHTFLLTEIKLRDAAEMARWQHRLSELFSYLLRHGMPMEQLQIRPFRDALFQTRNAEEALLVALNACARVTGRVSAIRYSTPTAVGAWFRRIQGQRTSPESSLAAACLSLLNLAGSGLDICDFYNTDLHASDLRDVQANHACLVQSDLTDADLRGARLYAAQLRSANLQRATLQGAELGSADLGGADLGGADLRGANIREAKFQYANLERALLEGTSLHRSDLRTARGLTQHQVDVAMGDRTTWLPAGLAHPKHWLEGPIG